MSLILEKNLKVVMDQVESSAIARLGYSANESKLYVLFKSNEIYIYHNVPLQEYNDLLLAESIGSYYNHCIKGIYNSEHINYNAIMPRKDYYYNMITNEIFENKDGSIFSCETIKDQKLKFIQEALKEIELSDSQINKLYSFLSNKEGLK